MYDDYGNMTADRNKGITSIEYNHLNLPKNIVFNNAGNRQISYLYNAAGIKVGKVVTSPNPQLGRDRPPIITKIDYFNGFQYINTNLQFFPTAEGYVDQTSLSLDARAYNYVFQFKDHLGNIRMNYALDPIDNSLKIKAENHYYPFGLKHNNYNGEHLEFQQVEAGIALQDIIVKPIPVAKLPYNYKYNGKE